MSIQFHTYFATTSKKSILLNSHFPIRSKFSLIREIAALRPDKPFCSIASLAHDIIDFLCHLLYAGAIHKSHRQLSLGESGKFISIFPQCLRVILSRPRMLQYPLEHLHIYLGNIESNTKDALHIITAPVIIGLEHITQQICYLRFRIPRQCYHCLVNGSKHLLLSADPRLHCQRVQFQKCLGIPFSFLQVFFNPLFPSGIFTSGQQLGSLCIRQTILRGIFLKHRIDFRFKRPCCFIKEKHYLFYGLVCNLCIIENPLLGSLNPLVTFLLAHPLPPPFCQLHPEKPW